MEEKLIRKSFRKQKRAYHRLLRDMNIKCCDNVTNVGFSNKSSIICSNTDIRKIPHIYFILLFFVVCDDL